MKKLVLILSFFIMLSSCGTVFKSERIFKPTSNTIDYDIMALDSLGLIFLVAPGLLMLSLDYITGALYLSPEEEQQFQPSSTQATQIKLIVE